MGRIAKMALVLPLAVTLMAAHVRAEVLVQNLSLDKPLVLDENTNYTLKNVSVTGLSDAAAITLTGRINSVSLLNCTFGRVWTGVEGKAAGLECVGAVVGQLHARNTTFFDAENQLATLRDGSFGRVTFERCRFSTSEAFYKQIQQNQPFRLTPPVTEFYNIDRLELLDNEYVNTIVVIHPSVKQVVLRGNMPGLKIQNPQSTELIQLAPQQESEPKPNPV